MSGITSTIRDAAPRGPADLAIRLFGPMEVRIGGRPMPPLRSRKGLWLLALLALRADRDVERAWLAGTLWPDCDDEHALRSLRQSVHNLRQMLGPEAKRLSGDSPRCLCLSTAGALVDVLEFDAAIKRGDPDSLEQAIRLYHGPLLEDCSEEWCLPERRRREQAYVTALQSLAGQAEARGDHGGAAERLRLAAGAEPFREDLQRARMEALARAGDPAAALAVYRELRSLLWKELSTEPDAETTALFRRIRDAARMQATVGAGLAPPSPPSPPSPSSPSSPSSPPSPPDNGLATPSPPGMESASTPPRIGRRAPLPLTPLIGREEAVLEVRALLGRGRLVTLAGPGGMGKTRLASQVAAELDREHEDGVCFAELAALADPAAVPDAVRGAAGLPPTDGREEPSEALTAALASRSLLLVLDNCEHLLAGCAALAQALLSRCPDLRILATSRHPLGLPGETVWRVPPLALPPASGAAVSASSPDCPVYLSQFAAVRLFVERARAVEHSFALTPDNAGAVLDICRRLDGIPLAVELAAPRVRSLPVEEIGRRLRRDFGLLTQAGAPVTPRHGTLAAAFQWSWDLLSDQERTILRRLSVFAGGCTLAAAEAVCAGGDIAAAEVLDLLTALVDASLVVYARDGDGRYRLLETVRQLAAERLREAGGDEEAETRARHRDYYLAWAEEIKPREVGAEQALWFARTEADHDNFRAALGFCRERGEAHAELRLAVALCRFWDTHGHVREGRERIEAAIARMTPDLPVELRADALGHAGWMAHVQGDEACARVHYERGLDISRQSGDVRRHTGTLNLLACTHLHEGDRNRARQLFEEARALCIHHGLRNHMAAVLNNLGDVLLQLGDTAAARQVLEEAVALCVEFRSHQLRGIALINLAMADLHEGKPDAARENCAEGLRACGECEAIVDIPGGLDMMASVARSRAQHPRAARLLGAASALRESVGIPPDAFTETEQSWTEAAAREALGAERFAQELAVGRAMDYRQAVAFALEEMPEEGGGP